MSLLESIRKISNNVEQQIDILRREGEEAVKQVSVAPLIEALGYDTRNLLEVKSQFMVENEWVDYAIMRNGQPIILVEAKRVRNTLSEKHWRQLHDYFGATEVQFAILTNGIDYQFYTDLKIRNNMDKVPFLTFNMRDLKDKLVKELESFTKSEFDPERSLLSAKRSALYRAVQKEFEHPSDEFVAYFVQRITTSLPTEADVYVLTEVLGDVINDRISAREPSVIEPEPPRMGDKVAEPANEINSPPVSEIIEIPVYSDYEGKAFEATLLFDPLSKSKNTYLMSKTKIRFDGEKMGVNDAELKARQSIARDAKQNWNGWKRWKLRDPSTGELRAIRDLLDDKMLRDLFPHDA